MDQPEILLLELLQHAITDADLLLPKSYDRPIWQKMIQLAKIHDVIPLVINAIWKLGQTHNISSFYVTQAKNKMIVQAQKTADFLLLYDYLAGQDLHPVVLKGIILRDIYPQPEQRFSTDEDILIDPAEFPRYHDAFLQYGLAPVNLSADLFSAEEVSYENKDMHLYIEVHKTPFLSDSDAFADFNNCFQDARDQSITQNIYNTEIRTLSYTDHLLYLILHALKHFLYSGFGIRQICDIILFSEQYRHEIDWSVISSNLQQMHAMDFTRAIYKIGLIYLLPENHLQKYLDRLDCMQIDEEPLLHDIITGGIYGASSVARLHSSNLTLQAAKQREKKGVNKLILPVSSVLHTVFLPIDKMSGRFPYLKKVPILLPIAWLQRLFGYLMERTSLTKHTKKKLNTAEPIRIGRSRVELLKQYGIIK